MTLRENFNNKIEEIFAKKDSKLEYAKKIVVALSGGSDSMALVFLLKGFCDLNGVELTAVTVDHEVREGSSSEAREITKILQKNDISHEILTINWSKKPNSNLEAKMREKRYELLHEYCQKNQVKYLFLGHQLDDIAENFLIRLFRGSSLDGLSPISELSDYKNITLVRPLLDVSKKDLCEFLKSQGISWFEDESNLDGSFLRNKMRNFLNSFEESDLIRSRIVNSSFDISSIRDDFDDLMLKKAKNILKFQDNKIKIDLEKLKKLEKRLALKILALSAMEMSQKDYKPRLEKLKKFYDWVLFEEKPKQREFYGCKVEKEGGFLIIFNDFDGKFKTILKQILDENC